MHVRQFAAGQIEYIDFPPALVGKYQCFTEADLSRLRDTVCNMALGSPVGSAEGVGVEIPAQSLVAGARTVDPRWREWLGVPESVSA